LQYERFKTPKFKIEMKSFSIRRLKMRRHSVLVSPLIFVALAISGHAKPSEIPAVGTPAPTFKLITDEGKKVSLADYKGKWVVLTFCATTFGEKCRLEAHNFQRDFKKYEQANAVILWVTRDTVELNNSFRTKEGLSFNLLSDNDTKVAENYGSAFGPKGARYSSVDNTFIIDPQGKIGKVFLSVDGLSHQSEQVLAALIQIQSGND
jgi:thioredoxin-dependent peroxiredoxin